jgi:type IV secretory pathway TraG/TraD family ATPase VirD4
VDQGDKRRRADSAIEEVHVEARVKSPELTVAMEHFAVRYWKQPADQLGGVQGTIYNYLNYFTNDEVAEVFCADNTFDFRDVDRGMILCVAMPQKLQVERRYVCTLLKLLFYQHVLRRFDLGEKSPEWIHRNLLICWQDEAQRFVTDSDGNVDVIREASATTFMACQAKPSLYAPLGGKEKASVTLLNLRNRIVFQAADDDCANGSSEFLGKVERTKKTHSTSSSGTSYSYAKEDTFLIKPHEFRALPKFTAVVCHADSKWRRALLCPITPDGRLRREWLTSAQRLAYWWQEKMGRGWAAVTRPLKHAKNVKN